MTEWLLLPIAFLTSCLAGAMGMGGGMLLLAAMPGLVPAAALLPVHAAVQLASNLSRAAFGWRDLDWGIVPAIALGAAVGAGGGAALYDGIDLHWLPAVVGLVILFITWVPLPQLAGGGQIALAVLGFYQTGIGMVAGATGPLGAAVLLQRGMGRDGLVVNTALYMSLNHCLRLLAFALLGFGFAPWLGLIAAMSAAGIAGSWVGTRLRRRLPQANFLRLFRVVVSLLALRMIAMPLLD